MFHGLERFIPRLGTFSGVHSKTFLSAREKVFQCSAKTNLFLFFLYQFLSCNLAFLPCFLQFCDSFLLFFLCFFLIFSLILSFCHANVTRNSLTISECCKMTLKSQFLKLMSIIVETNGPLLRLGLRDLQHG